MKEHPITVESTDHTVTSVFIPEYPVQYWYLPSGYEGKFIRVEECPIDGVSCKLVDQDSIDDRVRSHMGL